MWFLYLLGCIIAIVIDYIIAKKFKEIAEMKGHDGGTYFWFTFIFGLVGMLMVIALPIKTEDKNQKTTTLPPQDDFLSKYLAKNSTSTVKRCPYCGDVVKLGRCEMCGKEVK